jgi:putative aminopeptidase FrvX
MTRREATYELVRELSLVEAPSGREAALDAFLRDRLAAHAPVTDAAGNVVVRLAGRGEGPPVGLLAHKDEIGAVVKRIEPDGRVRVIGLGDAHPWIWGETPLRLLGDEAEVAGVLSFGARHISQESEAQHGQLDGKAVRWRDAWVETKLPAERLAAAGVRAGTRAVLGPARREPSRLGAEGEYVSGPALDDKVALAVAIQLCERLERPARDVEIVLTSREEIGCQGARFWARRAGIDDAVALEVAPVAAEYALTAGPHAVLVEGDARTVLHDGLGRELAAAALAAGVPIQHAFLARYGSDASTLYSDGLLARAACLAVAVENTHGCEIAHLDAVEACVDVLAAWLA